MSEAVLTVCKSPEKDCSLQPVALTDETMQERLDKVLSAMKLYGYDWLVIYGDVEHHGHFAYLAGFFTRFEEGLIVLHASGKAFMVLGNENFNKAEYARIPVEGILCPQFSLPHQPDIRTTSLKEILGEIPFESSQTIGVVGWKYFNAQSEVATYTFEVPHYIIEALIAQVATCEQVVNAAELFLGSEGVRRTNNANEIAHYEFYASLASDGMLDALDKVVEGVSEFELGDALVRYGQHTNVVTIAAAGPRFVKAQMFPRNHKAQIGDTLSLTVGYEGGLSSRAGFVVHHADELPEAQAAWLDAVALPYFKTYATWLEHIRIGMKGKDLHALVEQILPREVYGWSLCPGHLTANEEWLCSPVREDSDELLQSGMIFQIDIIPARSPYASVSCESTIALADENLRNELSAQYPALMERVEARRAYIISELGIALSPDVLPLCSTVGYMRPFMCDHTRACKMLS